jgi:hypothetical protein
MRAKTSVHHWRFEDGKTPLNLGSRWEMPPAPRGWYCWVYPENNDAFESRMAKNCPTADCTQRFNSGDPITTVYIKDDKEAMLFELKWR